MERELKIVAWRLLVARCLAISGLKINICRLRRAAYRVREQRLKKGLGRIWFRFNWIILHSKFILFPYFELDLNISYTLINYLCSITGSLKFLCASFGIYIKIFMTKVCASLGFTFIIILNSIFQETWLDRHNTCSGRQLLPLGPLCYP